MYTIDYQFQPEQEVYYINRFKRKIGKGKLINVHILNYVKSDDDMDTIIKYGIHDSDNKIIIDANENEVFNSYKSAAEALLN